MRWLGRDVPRLLVAGMLALLVPGCGQGSATADDDRPVVVTSTTVLADLVDRVGGGVVTVRSIVPVGGDPHLFEPRPSDAVAITRADLVVDSGLGLSPWLPPLLATRSGPVLDLGAAVGEVVRDDDGSPDPHTWMDPVLVADTYVPIITDALTALRPDRVDDLSARAASVIEDLMALDEEIRAILAPIPPQRRLLVTSHDAYAYFATAYDLTVVGTVVGVSTEEEPSARTVGMLIDLVRRLDIPTVFIETTVNPSVMERIAQDAGAAVGAPLYGDSLGPPGSGAETYDAMMRTNARHIADGLR